MKAISAPAGFQFLDYGEVTAIAGSSSRFAVATASGRILYYDAADNSLQGTINAYTAYSTPESSIGLSTDGSVLGVLTQAPNNIPSNLNVYSLPGGGVTNSIAPPSGISAFMLSGAGTDLALQFASTGSCDDEEIAVTGGGALWCDASGSLTQVQLSPDGSLVAASPAAGASSVVTVDRGNTTVAAVNGWVLGWLSNTSFLVNTFKAGVNGGADVYAGSTIYDSSGALQSSPALPQLDSMQVVSPTTIYGAQYNSIYSLSNGAVTWTSGSSLGSGTTLQGAVAGSEVIFVSGNYVLAEPFQ
jgi:hypothetical protein